jgi:hypothetical protein
MTSEWNKIRQAEDAELQLIASDMLRFQKDVLQRVLSISNERVRQEFWCILYEWIDVINASASLSIETIRTRCAEIRAHAERCLQEHAPR